MSSFATELLPVIILILLGAFLGAKSILSAPAVDGMKRLVSNVALPVLLFSSFSRMRPESGHLLLAVAIFAACALMGLAGSAISRAFRLPSPSTAFMFQGFEAGMLGYALFASLYGADKTPAFAAADLGQVLYVFTVLMGRLENANVRENGGPGGLGTDAPKARALAARLLSSPVLIAIGAGIAAAVFAPGAEGMPWARGGFLGTTLEAVGGITTPLVCLSVGFGLRGGFSGAGRAVLTVLTRMAIAAVLGSLIGFVLAPALGFDRLQSFAVLTLFLLPPPFIIPVFRNEPEESAYVSSTLSLHTILSLVAVALIAAISRGSRGGAA